MRDKFFLDTNVLVYTFDPREPRKQTERWKYSLYDALVIGAALEGGCPTLYSEDLHDGQVIEGLTIVNPFS